MDMPLLRVTLSRSYGLAASLALVHAAAAACVVAYVPGWGWDFAAGLALAASLGLHLRRDALLLAAAAVTEIAIREDGSCELATRSGNVLRGTVRASSFVSPWLVALAVQLDSGRRRSLVILPDSAPGEARRRLRVWLRFRLRPQAPGSAGA